MTKSIKPEFEKSAAFKGTQQEYEQAVDGFARLFPNGFDGDEARAFVPYGIKAEHVSARIAQLKQKP